MHFVRRLALTNRTLAVLVIAVALVMKVLVPNGFMPVLSEGRIVITICSGTGPVQAAMPSVGAMHGAMHSAMAGSMVMPAAHHGGAGETGHDGDGAAFEAPCAFAGNAVPSLAAVDPVVLAAAIAFVMAMAVRLVVLPARARTAFLRPPLRGPPIPA